MKRIKLTDRTERTDELKLGGHYCLIRVTTIQIVHTRPVSNRTVQFGSGMKMPWAQIINLYLGI